MIRTLVVVLVSVLIASCNKSGNPAIGSKAGIDKLDDAKPPTSDEKGSKMKSASGHVKNVEMIIRHGHCMNVTADEGAIDGDPADEVYTLVVVKTPQGLLAPHTAKEGVFGPYRIPEKPNKEEYWQFKKDWHTELREQAGQHGWLGVNNFIHGIPSVFTADVGSGERIEFEITFMEQDGKIEIGGIEAKYDDKNGVRITNLDIRKGEDDHLGTVSGTITNENGNLSVAWKAGKHAENTLQGNKERMKGASDLVGHFTLTGSGARYSFGIDFTVK